jgi:glycosyltransferase involved in cell wall biosynthesis
MNSILSQTFDSFEVIIINDGSTDSSPVLCDDYAGKDRRIGVFHKENQGISKTRQFGLDQAKGEYIFFLDSDDWLESDFFETVNKKLEENKPDILFMDFYKEKSNGKEKYVLQKPSRINTETVILLILEGKLSSCPWNILIKSEFIKKNNIKFNDKINYGEDSLFITELLLNNPVIDYIPSAFYHHTFNHNSFTRKNKKEALLKRLDFLSQLDFLLEKYSRPDLLEYNYFPLNDKYAMLKSGVFSKKEYQSLFCPFKKNHNHKQYGLKLFVKYLLLCIAETNFYFLSKFIAGTLLVKVCE